MLPEPPVDQLRYKTVQEVVSSCSSEPDVISKLKVTQEEILKLASDTVGQRDNPLWHQMRQGRVTASNFGVVLSAIRRNKYKKSFIIKHNLGTYNYFFFF